MNSKELKIEMMRNNENGTHLSKILGISRQTLSNKMCNRNGSDFTREEIAIIKDHYALSNDRVDEIFFG